MLRFLLLARGASSALFGLILIGALDFAAIQHIGPSGLYAVIDGLFGTAIALTLAVAVKQPLSAILAAIDAFVRLSIGMLLLLNSGLANSIFGSAIFFACIIVVCVSFGAMGVICQCLTLLSKQKFGIGQPLLWIRFTLSLSTILLGVGLGFSYVNEERRVLLGCFALVSGGSFILAWLLSGRAEEKRSSVKPMT